MEEPSTRPQSPDVTDDGNTDQAASRGGDPQDRMWSELEKLASKLGAVADPEIKSALQEALSMKADKFRPSLTRIPERCERLPELRELFPDLDVDKDVAVHEAPESSLRQPTAEDIERVDSLIRKAHLASIRRDRDETRRLLEEAEALAPNSPAVLEALGDEYLASGKTREARAMFERALKVSGPNVALEKKHAQTVFQTDAAAAGWSLEMQFQRQEAVASPAASMLFSLFIPGLGQMVNGQWAKGVTFLVAWLASWSLVYLIGFDNVLAYLGMKDVANPNVLAVVAAISAIVFHFLAIIDAMMKSAGRPPGRPQRPVPPSSLPFE
jgi:TM2 domain-containing membrane protein YozV